MLDAQARACEHVHREGQGDGWPVPRAVKRGGRACGTRKAASQRWGGGGGDDGGAEVSLDGWMDGRTGE